MDIKHFNRFICRIPQLPIDELDAYKQASNFDSYLSHFFAKKEFLEALFVASPDFLHEVELYIAGEQFSKKRQEKFRITALKYILRMCVRATPFGSFSGCATGYVGNETLIEPSINNRFTPIARLDMGLLISFSEYILWNKDLRRYLVFYPNNTIYEVNGHKRYVEFFSKTSGERFYNLASFEKEDTLERLLDHFTRGGSFSELVDFLRSDEFEEEDIISFINDLIDSKILISELEPVMTGLSYHDQLMSQIGKKASDDSIKGEAAEFFRKVYNLFQKVDELCKQARQPGERSVEHFKAILALCKQLPLKSPVKHYFQVDSIVNFQTKPVISEKTARQIEEGVRFFTKLAPLPTKTGLSTFRNKFKEKYNDQVVPLAEALDPDLGIGYSSVEKDMLDIVPFVDDLPMSSRPGDQSVSINWRKNFHGLLLNRIIDAKTKKEMVIELKASDLEEFPIAVNRLPPTFNAFVTLSGDDNSDPLIYFHNIGSASATCLLGRFGFMDEEVGKLTKDIAAFENSLSDDYIIAEVNHLSETRIGNVMLRPKIRTYEITYITKSNEPTENQINIDDLLLSVRNDRFILFSKRLNKQVVPRLSNAHNYHRDTLPVYKFLCDLQDQNAYSDIFLQLFMDVGSISQLVNFIPRIQYKNFVYYAATWYFTKAEIQQVYEFPDEQRVEEMCKYLRSRFVPQKFYLKLGDFDLYIDMKNPYSIEVMLSELSNQTIFTISEVVQKEDGSSAVHGASGRFSHEILLPIHKLVNANEVTGVRFDDMLKVYESGRGVKRIYLPGEEWVFLKLYGGLRYNEKFLCNKLSAFIEKLKEKRLINRWFFLRYSDPSSHIRLRLLLSHLDNFAEVMQILRTELESEIADGLVRNIVIDSYDRELERYNPQLIDASEKIFEADSEFCISVLSHPSFPIIESNRWYLCMVAMDQYLLSFNMDAKERYDFIKEMRNNFAVEFNASKVQRRHLINKYRNEKQNIEGLFKKALIGENDLSWFFREVEKFGAAVSLIYENSYSGLPFEEKKIYLNSFIHMLIIRFVISKNRLQEYVLYSLLEQHYKYSLGYQLMNADE